MDNGEGAPVPEGVGSTPKRKQNGRTRQRKNRDVRDKIEPQRSTTGPNDQPVASGSKQDAIKPENSNVGQRLPPPSHQRGSRPNPHQQQRGTRFVVLLYKSKLSTLDMYV